MVYSASIATAEANKFTGYQPAYYLLRHGVFIAVGLLIGLFAFQVPVQMWQTYAPYLFLIGAALLVLVLIPGIGREVNGSRRWLSLFVINLQPSELMKLFAVLYAADYTVRKGKVGHLFRKAFVPMLVVMVLIGGLLLQEPDMGAFVVICVIALCTLWLGGFNLKVFVALLLALPLAFGALIFSSPYRMQRVIGFMDPWSDPYGKGYQLSHALIAFRARRMAGRGAGRQRGKIVLPAGSAHRLFDGGDRGRIGPDRRGCGDRAVRAAGGARVPDRAPCRVSRAQLFRAGRAGYRRVDRRAGDDQYRREHGRAADQGIDPAVPEFWRQRHRGELRCGGGAAESGL